MCGATGSQSRQGVKDDLCDVHDGERRLMGIGVFKQCKEHDQADDGCYEHHDTNKQALRRPGTSEAEPLMGGLYGALMMVRVGGLVVV